MLILPTDFHVRKVNLDQIYLDPNNPRFATERDVIIPDEKIAEPVIQETCLKKMQEHDLDGLKESINAVGFIQVDKIVVRTITANEGKFVVLEGNRRIAALKLLAQENSQGEIWIHPDVLATITGFDVLVYTGKNLDMAWIIQGIRHISGVKSWQPYQQALTLYKMTQIGANVKEAAQTLGISSAKAVILIRAMHGFQYAKDASDYGDKLVAEHLAYFNEVIFKQSQWYQKYLKWDDTEKKFINTENLNKFLSWIFPESGKEPKITQARELRDDIVQVMIHHPKLFERWENDENMSVKELNIEVGKMEQKQVRVDVSDWLEIINEFNKDVADLPIYKIEDRKNEFITKMGETIKICERQLDILKQLSGKQCPQHVL